MAPTCGRRSRKESSGFAHFVREQRPERRRQSSRPGRTILRTVPAMSRHRIQDATSQGHGVTTRFAIDARPVARPDAANEVLQLARQLIAAHQPGSFLFLTSLHAGTPRNLPHYSTAKAALAMLVRELAKTFGRFGIRVNALVPGAIAAGGFVADPALAKHIPLGRIGEASDLAPLALAVLSNRISAYVTGAAIVIDGGLSLTNWFEPPALEDL